MYVVSLILRESRFKDDDDDDCDDYVDIYMFVFSLMLREHRFKEAFLSS